MLCRVWYRYAEDRIVQSRDIEHKDRRFFFKHSQIESCLGLHGRLWLMAKEPIDERRNGWKEVGLMDEVRNKRCSGKT